MIVGFMFGIFSFIRSLQAPSALLLFAVQYNVVADAFICIVPRILIGVIAFELYRHLKIREVWRIAVTAVLTPRVTAREEIVAPVIACTSSVLP